MDKVYVVTSGEYSDFGIDAIFATEELAQIFVDSFAVDDRSRELNITEWTLNPNEKYLKQNRNPYFLQINKKGDIRDICACESDRVNLFRTEISDAKIHFTKDLEWMNIACFANNEEHAVKIASEKRSQILAANLWGVLNLDDDEWDSILYN